MMKYSKVLKSILTIAALFMVLIATASENFLPKLKIKALPGSKKIVVEIKGMTQNADLAIKDPQGVILIEDRVEGAEFTRIYNMSLVAEGDYELILSNLIEEIVQPLTIHKNKLEIDEQKRQVFYLPIVRLKQKTVNLMLLNSQPTDVTLKIQNKIGDLVYQDKLNNVLKVEKSFDVAALERGRYVMIIETEERTFYRDFYHD